MRIQSGRLEHTRQDLRIAGCGRVSRLQALNRERVIAEQRYMMHGRYHFTILELEKQPRCVQEVRVSGPRPSTPATSVNRRTPK